MKSLIKLVCIILSVMILFLMASCGTVSTEPPTRTPEMLTPTPLPASNSLQESTPIASPNDVKANLSAEDVYSKWYSFVTEYLDTNKISSIGVSHDMSPYGLGLASTDNIIDAETQGGASCYILFSCTKDTKSKEFSFSIEFYGLDLDEDILDVSISNGNNLVSFSGALLEQPRWSIGRDLTNVMFTRVYLNADNGKTVLDKLLSLHDVTSTEGSVQATITKSSESQITIQLTEIQKSTLNSLCELYLELLSYYYE